MSRFCAFSAEPESLGRSGGGAGNDLAGNDRGRYWRAIDNPVGNTLKFAAVAPVNFQIDSVPQDDCRRGLRLGARDGGIEMTTAQKAKRYRPPFREASGIARKTGGAGRCFYVRRDRSICGAS